MLYDKIKEICKKNGVSVSAVEKEAGLSNGTISKWNESSPSVDNLKAVANVLKIKVERLIL